MMFPDRLRTNFELVRQFSSTKPFEVFLVKDKTKDLRTCVLRILPDSLSGDNVAVDAFTEYFSKFSEIINRAYIPTVYSVSGQAGSDVYVLEENVSGIDLTTFVRTKLGSAGFEKEIIGIVGKVCEALHHAHQKDMFHLNITPEDILIDETTDRVKLVGFGAQIFAQVNKIDLLSEKARKTTAPEIVIGASFKPSSDVYSLAKAINHVCPEVFSNSEVLSKAFSDKPSDRYQTARDFESALKEVLEDINRSARFKNIDTPLESKGGLKPVLTQEPVTVERDFYDPSPRKTETPIIQPQIRPDTVMGALSTTLIKSISTKRLVVIAVGVLVTVMVVVLLFWNKKYEITRFEEAQRLDNLYKQRIEREQPEKEQGLPAFAWNYPEDVKKLLKRAIKGDGDAQFNLGERYVNGWGVPKDYGEALKWYRQAAEQGLARAQHNLGQMYMNGWGVCRKIMGRL